METRIFRILCVKSNGYPTLNSQPALESSNANFFPGGSQSNPNK